MSFSVVIDSVDAYATNSVYDKKYAIDWSFLPEGEYDLTFSFEDKLFYNKKHEISKRIMD